MLLNAESRCAWTQRFMTMAAFQRSAVICFFVSGFASASEFMKKNSFIQFIHFQALHGA